MIAGNLNALLRKFHFLGVYQYWYTIYPYWYTLYQYWYNDTNIGINIPKSGKSILSDALKQNHDRISYLLNQQQRPLFLRNILFW